ncbi:hypothetical protein PR048_027098 [Dryococelus australis]|uniref:DDE Tnp4 domain-containing protein n=1 Tax=Dryococelus australis TaxID=614101 RepID=A0ABQ9GEH8_9NEOP|nr:hypothetical protein PR048_027098 [Dryococelus australis]
MKGWGKWEIPEKTRRKTASPDTIPTCENPLTRPGFKPGSPWRRAYCWCQRSIAHGKARRWIAEELQGACQSLSEMDANTLKIMLSLEEEETFECILGSFLALDAIAEKKVSTNSSVDVCVAVCEVMSRMSSKRSRDNCACWQSNCCRTEDDGTVALVLSRSGFANSSSSSEGGSPSSSSCAMLLKPLFLVTGESMRSLVFQFRICHQHISRIIKEVLKAVHKNMLSIYLPEPTIQSWLDRAEKFSVKWNFPNEAQLMENTCLSSLPNKKNKRKCLRVLGQVLRIFYQPIAIDVATVDYLIMCCCIIHNMIREEYCCAQQGTQDTQAKGFQYPQGNVIPLRATHARHTANVGERVRKQFTEYVCNEGSVPWQVSGIQEPLFSPPKHRMASIAKRRRQLSDINRSEGDVDDQSLPEVPDRPLHTGFYRRAF